MRVLFVCQNDFAAPTEKQIAGWAQGLVRHGHDVMISVGRDPASARREGLAVGGGLDVRGHTFAGGRLQAEDIAAVRRFAPDVVHAANPRVPTVSAARSYADATGAAVVGHFEDDEWHPTPGVPGESWLRPVGRLGRRMLSRAYPGTWVHASRSSLRWICERAAALEALTPALAGEVRARTGRACAVVLPVTPDLRGDGGPRRALDLPSGSSLVAFTGSILPVYLDDVVLALRALAALRSAGTPVRLVHAGPVHARLDLFDLAAAAGLSGDGVIALGHLPMADVPTLLRSVDVLLQPGAPSEFNRLRLPAKLALYLASGTPTVTFATGFGELLADRREALLTRTAGPTELAARIAELLEDAALRDTLARGGPCAARRLFDRERNTRALEAVYADALR